LLINTILPELHLVGLLYIIDVYSCVIKGAFPVPAAIRAGRYKGHALVRGAEMSWSVCLHYGCRVQKVRPFPQQEQETFLLETSHAISVPRAVDSGGVSLEIKRLGRETDRPHFSFKWTDTCYFSHPLIACKEAQFPVFRTALSVSLSIRIPATRCLPEQLHD